ncbi:MAG TPA: Ig-like domain-containing protein, partial [Candidatus Thermoplasmatota archaeon]|nr:Ig-like domain-containing protein [Candidatus Thermoplasmatota archaeon]
APSIALTAPSNASVIPAGTTLDFALSDVHTFNATWSNGSGGPFALASPFDVSTAGWPDGATAVTLSATDVAGNARTRAFVFTLDSTRPSIALVAPSNNSAIAAGTTLDFTVSDANLQNATWNNGSGALPLVSPFNVDTTAWADGPIDVEIVALDLAGNSRAVSFHFEMDSTPPTVTLVAPANNSVIGAGTMIDLNITDLHGVASASWNNGSGPVALPSPFDINTSAWADGDHNLTIVATDGVGNIAPPLVIHFFVDRTPPSIVLEAPSAGAVIRPGTTLDFAVTDTYGLGNVSWNNGSGLVGFVAPFTVNTTGWIDGAVNVTVTAIDAFGNIRASAFAFTIDGTAPAVSLVSPANNSVVTAGTLIDTEIVELHLVSATWNNGSGPVSLTSPFNIPTTGWADGAYTLTVNATDEAGNFASAWFRVTIDTTSPNITLVAPANNSVIAGGTVLDLSIVELNLNNASWSNGSAWAALTSPFDISTAGWLDGSVTVSLSATDLAGNARTSSFRFTMDSTYPTLLLASPANGSVIAPGATLDFDAADANLANVSWNNGSGPNALPDPYDLSTASWPEGNRNITVIAVDLAGNARTLIFFFTFDGTPPTVTLVTPANNTIILAGTVIDLTVSDLHLDEVTWDNSSGTNTLTSPFNIATTGWPDGAYNITIIATDLAGNVRYVVLRYTFDTTPPTITLLSPSNNSFVRAGTTLDLLITDLTALSVTWDNTSGPNTILSPYDVNTAGWGDGSVDLTVVATDAVGNSRTRVFHFTFDSTLPAITLLTPTNNSVIRPGVAINFSITDTNFDTATWDNGGGAAGFATQWSISTTGWADGPYNVIVDATDLAGNARTRVFRFTIDSVLPAVTLNTPSNNSYIAAGTVINLTISDVNLATATWDDGTGAQTFTTAWNISTTGWSEGSINITVSAADGAGNSRTRIFHFTIDSTLPALSLLSPTNNSYFGAGMLINFSLSDTNLDAATWDNGGGAQSFVTQWNISTTGWSDASYNITVTVTDLAGNSRTRIYRFTVDSTPPAVSLTSPGNNSYVDAGTAVALAISDTNFNTATWDTGSGPQSFVTQWTISTTAYADGSYNFTVVARDLAGNAAFRVYRVWIDSTAPTIAPGGSTPANGSYFNGGRTLQFDIVEAHLLSATWNNGTSGNVSFSAPFQVDTAGWQDGVFDLALRAADRAGHQAYYVYRFTVGLTAPSIALVSPANDSYVDAGTTVTLTIVDTNLNTATWDNGGGTTNFAAQWTIATAGWSDASYNITVTVTDLAGNSRSRVYHIWIDSTAPTVSLNAATPQNGSYFDSGVVLVFDVIEAHILSSTWNNGTSGNVSFTAPFQVSTALWPDGGYNLTVRVTDRALHQAYFVYRFTLDSVAPSIANVSWEGGYFEAGWLLNGTYSDSNPLWWSHQVDLLPPQNGSSNGYQVDTAGLADGAHSVRVQVGDRAAHVSVRVFLITIDSDPPQIQNVLPADGSFFQPGTLITFTVLDNNTANVTWQRNAGGFLPANGTGGLRSINTNTWGDGNWTVR